MLWHIRCPLYLRTELYGSFRLFFVVCLFVCLFVCFVLLISLYDGALGPALQTENITLSYPGEEAEFGVAEFVKDKARGHVFVVQNHS